MVTVSPSPKVESKPGQYMQASLSPPPCWLVLEAPLTRGNLESSQTVGWMGCILGTCTGLT